MRWARQSIVLGLSSLAAACGSGADGSGGAGSDIGTRSTTIEPPAATCAEAADGSATVATPELWRSLSDRWEEGWLGSPAVADLDRDGTAEIVVPRYGSVVVWRADGVLVWRFDTDDGRIWSSAVVGDFLGDAALEVAVAARDKVFLLDANGQLLPGFPVSWEDEMRSLAAGDVDGDGALEIVAAVGKSGPTDVINAWNGDASPVVGFPPNATGASGCDDRCYLAGCYDQNLAVGDLDGDERQDIVAPHDNAYTSIHKGTGEAFDANAVFQAASKTPGTRYLHDYALAQQGWAEDEQTANQAHFTNTSPAIADIDGDGVAEIVMTASVQNAAQTERERGVALWVVRSDASRPPGWEEPFHADAYLSGLWDYGDNIVAISNQVTVADIHPDPGLELIFAGFDGFIHVLTSDKRELWRAEYTRDPEIGTGGVAVGDLSGDGKPELVFATYGTGQTSCALFVLDAGGNELHRLDLPRRGAMAVPTLADVDGDGSVEIVVSLKDAEDRVESVQIYRVSSSAENCLPWPTGRANLLRNGWTR